MSETLRKYGAKFNRTFCTFTGLSTDTKPTGVYEGVNIANGSEFIEMDTDKKYLYDADSQTWKLAASGGGGGGSSAAETELIQLIQRTATSIHIPSGTTVIGEKAFLGCYDLTSVTIPNTVTTIKTYAFGNCNSLEAVEIPSSVTEIEGYAFEGCEALSSLTLNEGIVTIGRFAFAECAELTSVEIPSTITSLASDAFDSCSNITTIIVHKAEGSITGAPWGATNATVTWDGE